jgi:hypothetical protein
MVGAASQRVAAPGVLNRRHKHSGAGSGTGRDLCNIPLVYNILDLHVVFLLHHHDIIIMSIAHFDMVLLNPKLFF